VLAQRGWHDDSGKQMMKGISMSARDAIGQIMPMPKLAVGGNWPNTSVREIPHR
jgi:hypothetical protein